MQSTFLKNHFLRLFNYTIWRHRKVHHQLLTLPQQFLTKDFKCLFFTTPKGTLDHLILSDELWQMRLFGTWESNSRYLKLCQFWKEKDGFVNYSKKEGFLGEYLSRVEGVIGKYKGFVQGTEQGKLEKGEIRYKDTKGEWNSIEIRNVLTHVVNHHTHHLGQLSAAYRDFTGKDDFVSIDYLYYKD